MARILEGYRLRYRLSDRALAYVREVPAAGLSPEWRHGRQSRPFLEVWVLPDRVVLEVTHLYASGHMELYTAGGVLASAPGPDGLEAWLDAEERARVDRVRAQGWGEGWQAAAFALFTPKTAVGPDQVPPEDADFFELGGSVSGDGKLPYLTLRLGRDHDEIVLDHSFVFPDRRRRIEVLDTLRPGEPASSERIVARFGAPLAEVATWFHAAGRPFGAPRPT